MQQRPKSFLLAAALSALIFSACIKGPQLTPTVTSSEGSPFYATEAPQRLDTLTKHLTEGRELTSETVNGFASFPDRLTDPPRELVKQILKEADEAGRRHDVVEAFPKSLDLLLNAPPEPEIRGLLHEQTHVLKGDRLVLLPGQ